MAGTSYFNPAVMGKPIVWANGILSYYTDLGDLSPIVPHSQANSMIAAAAAVWNAVPTAAVSTSSGYVLNPIGSSGLPVRMYITAVTGSSAMLSFELEQYP